MYLASYCSAAFLIATITTLPGAWAEDEGREDTSKALFFRDSNYESSIHNQMHVVGRDTIIDIRKRDIVSEKTSSSLTPNDEGMRRRRSGDEAGVRGRSRRAVASDFTASDADAIVAKHNEGRSMVEPEAADMKTMEWDSTLASMAQEWSDGCLYEHGNPTNISPFNAVGQNLYILWGLSEPGTPPDGTRATEAWYNEYQFYNYDDLSCQAGEQCGHYTQNVWASTYAVGCGLTFCPTATDNAGNQYNGAWLITCNYGPAGNYVGQKPYAAGPSCTKCDSGKGTCKDNLCSDCSVSESDCECRAVCQNCGTLNNDCSCTCQDGWYGSDCATACEDTHQYCGPSNGWPVSWCDRSYVINGCPLLCSLCNEADPNFVCTQTTPAQQSTPNPATSPPTTLANNPTTLGGVSATLDSNPTTLSTTIDCDPPTMQSQSSRGEVETPSPTGHSLSSVSYDPVETTTVAATPTSAPACSISMCLHDSTFEEDMCNCNCTRNYFGEICQHTETQQENGILILLNEDINNWESIQLNVLAALRESVIGYCTNRQSTCCPAANNTVIDFSSTGLTVHSEYPVISLDYDTTSYWIQVTGISPVAPGVCQTGDGGLLGASVVLAAIRADETSLESSLNINIGETRASNARQIGFSLYVIIFNILLVFLLHSDK